MSGIFRGVAGVIGRVSTAASTSASRWSLTPNAAPSLPSLPAHIAPIATLTTPTAESRFLAWHPALACAVRGKKTGMTVYVGENNDVDRAMRKLRRKMIGEGLVQEMKDRRYFRKGSDKRVEARSMREYKTRKQMLRRRLGWIMHRKERGF